MQRLYPQLAGDLIDAKGVNLILERGVYSHNCNKLNKTNHAFGEDIKRIMKNSSMSESSSNCPGLLPSLVHRYVVFGIEHKIQYVNPCSSRKKLNKLNDFAPLCYFLIFWSNSHRGPLLERSV